MWFTTTLLSMQRLRLQFSPKVVVCVKCDTCARRRSLGGIHPWIVTEIHAQPQYAGVKHKNIHWDGGGSCKIVLRASAFIAKMRAHLKKNLAINFCPNRSGETLATRGMAAVV